MGNHAISWLTTGHKIPEKKEKEEEIFIKKPLADK
jgi:hypothetical protein